MKRRNTTPRIRRAPTPRAVKARRGSPLPVAIAVLGAVVILGCWQLRVAADETAAKARIADAPVQEPLEETPRDASADPTGPATAADRRLREGTQLTNCLGHFRQTGDVVAFIDENGRDIGGLPNLNLERIARMLKAVDEPETVWWSVSGTVTEFSGKNYVLITRAVYKASTPPPTPESLSAESEPQP